MGIDFGTESCRVGIFDLAGSPVACAATTYKTTHPHPGWAEQSPPRPTEAQSYGQVVDPPRPTETPSYGEVVEPPKKKNNKTLWIIIIVVVLIICCCCIVAIVGGNNLMKEFNIDDFEDFMNEFSQVIKIAPALI